MPEPYFLGLPAHPFLVHMPIVLVPLLALLVIGYVLIPPLRRHLGWVVMVLTVAVPIVVFLARWSGEHLQNNGDYSGQMEAVKDHANYSTVLIWLVVVLAPLTWLFGALERGRRAALARQPASVSPTPQTGPDGETLDLPATQPMSSEDPAGKGRRIVMTVLGLVMLGLVLVAGYYIFKAGHSGTDMRWS